MKKLPLALVTLFFSSSLVYGDKELDALLEEYKQKSDLSNITKRESAGFLTLFTRDDLEKMQARTLMDVLKLIPGALFKRGSNGLVVASQMSLYTTPSTSVRLYINDHDMTSASFGSVLAIFGDIPIEFIDHIEFYKATSSIEFGNEPGNMVVRLYIKNPKRERGEKVRVVTADNGSYDLNIYSANVLDNGISYFAYVNSDNTKRDVYQNIYNNKIYDLKSDHKSYNLFATIGYKKSKVDIGYSTQNGDSFLGNGIHKTPSDGELDADHFYTHFTQKLPQEFTLQLAADFQKYKRSYVDENNIVIANGSNGYKQVTNYFIEFEDIIYSAILEKKMHFQKHSFLAGAFYKYKEMRQSGQYSGNTNLIQTPEISNVLNLSSLYLEYNYDYNPDLRLIAMIKGDFYRYEKSVKSQNEHILRLGTVKKIDQAQIKLFYTDTYLPNSFLSLYNPQNTPYYANPNLDHQQMDIYSASISYKEKKWDVSLFLGLLKAKKGVSYKPGEGYYNISDEQTLYQTQLETNYYFDINNRIYASLFMGDNPDQPDVSPKYGAIIRLNNKYEKFDIYNELRYLASYSYNNINVDASYNWTLSTKYHYNKDMSIGLRGENLLDKSYAVVYRGYAEPIQVYDRRVWLNLEYLF